MKRRPHAHPPRSQCPAPSYSGRRPVGHGHCAGGGGGQLIGLGGSWYYLLAGLGVGASALLLLTHRGQALLVFAAVLAGSTVWAWWEVHLDWWQLVPRLALWFVVGLVLWLPWVRNSMSDAGRLPANALLVALVMAGARHWPRNSPSRIASPA